MYASTALGCFFIRRIAVDAGAANRSRSFLSRFNGIGEARAVRRRGGLRENYFFEFEATFSTSFALPTAFWILPSAFLSLPSTPSLAPPSVLREASWTAPAACLETAGDATLVHVQGSCLSLHARENKLAEPATGFDQRQNPIVITILIDGKSSRKIRDILTHHQP